jgi:uncharacterized protein (TIGR00369 family)
VSGTRSLTLEWADPMPTAAAAMARSGLEQMRAIVSGELPPPPMAVLMGMTVAEVEDGRAVFVGQPGEQHFNPIGVVHGGFAATMLDSAMGCAVQTTLPAGRAYTTLEVKVNFVRAIGLDTGPVLAEATVLHRGRQVATAEARLAAQESGKLLAHGTTTCQVFDVPTDAV